jgi:hypothetical protein
VEQRKKKKEEAILLVGVIIIFSLRWRNTWNSKSKKAESKRNTYRKRGYCKRKNLAARFWDSDDRCELGCWLQVSDFEPPFSFLPSSSLPSSLALPTAVAHQRIIWA